VLKTGISSRFFAQLNVRHSKSTEAAEGRAIFVEVERLEGSNCDVEVLETVVAVAVAVAVAVTAVAVEVGVAVEVEVDAVMTTGPVSQSLSLPSTYLGK
jgi:hypothetical protein